MAFNSEKPAPILVVGAGLAGLFTALRLAPKPVLLVSPHPLGNGASSSWAQGGIAAAVGEGDTPHAHARDTIAAGGGLVDDGVAEIVAHEAGNRIAELASYGVPFDRDLEGRFELGHEAAHSRRRIVRVCGDRAGSAIMAALIAKVRNSAHIELLENVRCRDLILRDGRVCGAVLQRNQSADLFQQAAQSVVLASGGVGHLFARTTNPAGAIGPGLAMAARAGAFISDSEFVQFHPTAIDIGLDPCPLASEALRGEGATLVNRRGDRFMPGVHDDAELAPRDVVARAVFREVEAGRGAFLDCRAAIGSQFSKRFPTIYAHCRKGGIDPAVDLIPVAPAAHYHMGGVKTDMRARTTLPGLWACGEVAATGLHGANRLASNSLIEAVVFAGRAAEDILGTDQPLDVAPLGEQECRVEAGHAPLPDMRRAHLMQRLRTRMAKDVGVIRSADGLRRALDDLADLERKGAGDQFVQDAVLVAKFIAVGAIMREESRGAHFRQDVPKSCSSQAVSYSRTIAEVERLSSLMVNDSAERSARG